MKLERSCGAVVFTRTEEEPMYVLVRSHKGHYGFPKGHMETGETEEETALREIREETGLDARLISGFKETDEYPVNAEGDLKRVTFYLGEYTEKRVAPLEKDVAEAVSLSFEEAVERLTHESLRRILAAAHAFILKAPKPYYEAYEERYKAAHEKGVCWFDGEPSNVVARVMERYGITRRSSLLEIGCGEGRDAGALLQSGFDLTATDVSPEAIAYCRRKWPEYAARFKVLDCVKDSLEERFDFIYAVAVVHMLLADSDRQAFYGFIREHLSANGLGLVCTMGDGTAVRQTDPATAFYLQKREEKGQPLWVASTSCRMVDFETFEREIAQSGMETVEKGVVEMLPHFDRMMYAVVRRKNV